MSGGIKKWWATRRSPPQDQGHRPLDRPQAFRAILVPLLFVVVVGNTLYTI